MPAPTASIPPNVPADQCVLFRQAQIQMTKGTKTDAAVNGAPSTGPRVRAAPMYRRGTGKPTRRRRRTKTHEMRFLRNKNGIHLTTANAQRVVEDSMRRIGAEIDEETGRIRHRARRRGQTHSSAFEARDGKWEVSPASVQLIRACCEMALGRVAQVAAGEMRHAGRVTLSSADVKRADDLVHGNQ